MNELILLYMGYKKNIISFAILAVLALLVFPYINPLTNIYYGDSSVYMVISEAFLYGKIPYKDYFDDKGPLFYLFQIAGQYVGRGNVGIFILFVLNLFFVLKLFCKISTENHIDNKPFLYTIITIVFVACMVGNTSEEWSILFQMAPLFLFFRYLKSNRLPYLYSFIYGVCFASIFLIRLNNAVVNCAIIFTHIIVLLRNRKYQELLQHLFFGLIGFLVAIVPFVLFFIYKDGIEELIRMYVFDFNYFKVFHNSNPNIIIYNILLLSCCPLLAYYTWKARNNIRFELRMMCYTISVLTFLLYYKSAGFSHYFMVVIPVFILLLIIKLFNRERKYYLLSVLVVALPYTPLFARTCARFVIYNIVYQIPALYEKTGDIGGKPQKITNDYAEIMSRIPEKDKDSIYMYNTFPFSGIMINSGHSPIGHHFYLQDILYDVDKITDSKIEKEINYYILHHKARWVIAGKSCNTEFNNGLEKSYKCVFYAKNINIKLYIRNE